MQVGVDDLCQELLRPAKSSCTVYSMIQFNNLMLEYEDMFLLVGVVWAWFVEVAGR